MMKRTMTMAMTLTGMLFGTIGCSAAETVLGKPIETTPEKILVAYYSWSPDGNTRYAAEQIQKATGGTLFEIKPKTAYPSEYRACVDQAKKECREGFKPELSVKVEAFKKYDVIFVGSPNWWGTMAPPVLTFLNSYDFAGKKVIPFFTHGGGGMQNCERDVRKNAGKAEVLPAKAFSGSSIRRSDKQIADWVGSLLILMKKGPTSVTGQKKDKTLIVYYSYSGNTKAIAERIQKTVGGDIACIETVVPYKGTEDEVSAQGKDEVNRKFKPAIKPLSVDLKNYSRIIIGTPTWWYTMAPAVLTFISSNDFSGKTVVPFMTNAGWPGTVIKDMKSACKGAAFVHEKEFVFGSGSANRKKMITPENELSAWIESLRSGK